MSCDRKQRRTACRWVIVHDDLKANPGAVYGQLLRFLGLENDGRDDFGQLNKSKKVQYPTLLKVLYFANRVRKRLGIPGMGRGLYKRTYQLGLTEGKAELRPEFRKELQDYFRDEVRILSKLLERDLGHWLADG